MFWSAVIVASHILYKSGIHAQRKTMRRAGIRNRGCTLWLTGLSGAGKTTLAFALEEFLISQGILSYVLDGDNIRSGLCGDLGFDAGDCDENIRRVAHLATYFAQSGCVTVCSVVSPCRDRRTFAKTIHQRKGLRFFEVHVDTPIEECEKRDTKGLYYQARMGKLGGFLGGSDHTYEEPRHPDLRIRTVGRRVPDCVMDMVRLLQTRTEILSTKLLQEAHERFRVRVSGTLAPSTFQLIT